eukprot:3046495-Rhodomonas_salina.3
MSFKLLPVYHDCSWACCCAARLGASPHWHWQEGTVGHRLASIPSRPQGSSLVLQLHPSATQPETRNPGHYDRDSEDRQFRSRFSVPVPAVTPNSAHET